MNTGRAEVDCVFLHKEEPEGWSSSTSVWDGNRPFFFSFLNLVVVVVVVVFPS